jgi:DNA-binding PadR family transcriptional regulator
LRIEQLSNLELDVMAAVLKHPEGADSASIRDAFEGAQAVGRPSLSAICNTLDRLDHKNLVSWTQDEGAADGFTDGVGRKDRRYTLTARGLDLFRRLMPSRRHLPGN